MGVTAQVATAYLEILSGQELLAAVLAQKEALEAEKDRVGLFLAEGKAPRVALLRVEATLSRVEAEEISAGADVELARSHLARLLGMEPGEMSGLELDPVQVGPPPDLPLETALALALEASPELRRAREELLGARAGVGEANAAWYPRVEAAGRYADFGTVEGGHVQEWQGALQISYPLFTGGAREGEREGAKAREREAAESLRLAEMRVKDEVEATLAGVREARALREALEVAVEQSEEVARIEALALDAGAGVQTDYLTAQAELFQARASLSRARHGEVLARVELARVTGDLSLQWIQENTEAVR
jgi:outer membrane protein TolC